MIGGPGWSLANQQSDVTKTKSKKEERTESKFFEHFCQKVTDSYRKKCPLKGLNIDSFTKFSTTPDGLCGGYEALHRLHFGPEKDYIPGSLFKEARFKIVFCVLYYIVIE